MPEIPLFVNAHGAAMQIAVVVDGDLRAVAARVEKETLAFGFHDVVIHSIVHSHDKQVVSATLTLEPR